jgi:hypothetical protein
MIGLIRTLLLLQAVLLPHRPAAGTYQVRFCAANCDAQPPGEVLASGILVLDTVERPYEVWPSGKPNACFDLQRSRHLHSYAALFPHSSTFWGRLGGDTIAFKTYRSPDAGHQVRAVLTDSGFVGVGRSWGAGVAEIHEPDEFVVGTRLGPPDLLRCSSVREERRWAWFTPPVFTVLALTALLLASRFDR